MLARGWLPVYVDLWKDRTADPAVLLGDAIKQALAELDGMVLKAARAMHLTKVGVAGALASGVVFMVSITPPASTPPSRAGARRCGWTGP